MKKKLFLAFLILTMLACIFVISVNAEEISTPSYDRAYTIDGVSYPLWEQDDLGNYHPLIWYLNSENEMCSVWADGQKNANGAYVSFDCSGTMLSKAQVNEGNATYVSNSSFVIVNFNGVQLTSNQGTHPIKYITFQVFHTDSSSNDNTANYFTPNNVLKAVFLPSTLSQIGWHDRKVVSASSTAMYTFSNCKALEYVEFHSNTVLNDNTLNNGSFTNCSSLKALSLPDSIKVFGNAALAGCTSLEAVYLPSSLTTLSSAGNSFANSQNMYFVNEPFTMNSAGDVPSKPEVYYLPKGLTSFGAAVLSSNANEIIVISESVTSHSTKMFAGSGVKTAVYLGNMTSFALTSAQSTALNILLLNTEAVPTVSATGSTNGSAVYLCKLNKFYSFDEKAWKDGTVHIEDPSKSFVVKEPTCVDNAKKSTTCFCGVYIGEAEIENSNIGGEHDLDEATLNISYTDYTKVGHQTLICKKCGAENVTEAPALFVNLGYSAAEYGDAMSINFKVNEDAIAKYESAMGIAVNYGVFAVMKDKIGDKDIFDADKKAEKGVIAADITDSGFTLFNLKIVGFTEEQKEIDLAMGAFVGATKNGATEYSYLQIADASEGKYFFASYNDVLAMLPKEDEVA